LSLQNFSWRSVHSTAHPRSTVCHVSHGRTYGCGTSNWSMVRS